MRDLGKLIVAKGFKKLPKVQKIAQSGHTACGQSFTKSYSKVKWMGMLNFCSYALWAMWGMQRAAQAAMT